MIRYVPLLPLMVLAGAAASVLLAIAVRRSHGVALALALAGQIGALLSLLVVAPLAPRAVTSLIVMDSYALFYLALILMASIFVTLLTFDYMRGREERAEELYVMLLLATLGSGVLVCASHFASFFLGLEILTVSLYTMIAYLRERAIAIEAGIKYLVLAGVSGAFLLFGMALIYAEVGTMAFRPMASLLLGGGVRPSALILLGLSMLVIGLGFKLAVVPFHMWTPDVYEGAPAPVAAYIATVSKGAVFALLLRTFTHVHIYAYTSLLLVFGLISVASMFLGNWLALRQSNVKRLLAYSSIAHLGYLLVAFLATGELASVAVAFYLTAYFITTLVAFGILAILSPRDRDVDNLEDMQGLAWRHPWLAAFLTAALLSLAGIPLTAGFVGKFTVLTSGVDSSLWTLVIFLVINSAIGLYYYLRVVVALFKPPFQASLAKASLPLTGGVALSVLTLALVGVGVYPAPLLELIRMAMG